MMDRRKFLKRSLEEVVIGSILLIYSCSENPVKSDMYDSAVYKIETYKNLPIKEYETSSWVHPLEIRLINYQPGEKIKAAVYFENVGWIESDDRNNREDFFQIVVTDGKLGKIENYGTVVRVYFSMLEITESSMKGKFVPDDGFVELIVGNFTAVRK